MPCLDRPTEFLPVALKPRTARLAGETDVLVVGGGPAGLGAALSARWAGSRVILAERYGFFGGNATAALVMPLASYYTSAEEKTANDPASLFPLDHGRGEPIIDGALSLLVKRLVNAGGALPPSQKTGYVVPFDAEIFKSVALDLLDEAGVHFLLHALGTDIVVEKDSDSQIRTVVFETKSGPLAIRAKIVVDCTGDGDIAAQAGASYEIGRPEDGAVQPMSLLFRMTSFDRKAFASYVYEHPDQWHGISGLWQLIEKATQDGRLHLARENILFFGTPHQNEVSVNSTRITDALGTDVWDLTAAEREGRRQMDEITRFLRAYVPGFSDSYVVQSGTQVCVRETRRITGDYHLTSEDILTARTFDDVIARGSYPVDIHNPKGPGTTLKHLPPGKAYDIPVRCLLPRNMENLLVAGRCISGTHEALSSYRVMPICMATGQAAGALAALAAKKTYTPREVPIRLVQQVLTDQGANLRGIV